MQLKDVKIAKGIINRKQEVLLYVRIVEKRNVKVAESRTFSKTDLENHVFVLGDAM